mmetsp:Transcript_16784/g.16679  ORF Transcript_16784/g.16679 Transcript_16784/m.16679 type:complete len:82 (+) Transcript_16784:3444-3689(+)
MINELKEKLKSFEKTAEQKEQKTKEKADMNKKLDEIEKMNVKLDEVKALIEVFSKRQEELAAPSASASADTSVAIPSGLTL